MANLKMTVKGLCLFRLADKDTTKPNTFKDVSVLLINAMSGLNPGNFDDCNGQPAVLHPHQPWLIFDLSHWDIGTANAKVEVVAGPDMTQFGRVDLTARHLSVREASGPVEVGPLFRKGIPSLKDALYQTNPVQLSKHCLDGPFGSGSGQCVAARIDIAGGTLNAERPAHHGPKEISWQFPDGVHTPVHKQPLTEWAFHELSLGAGTQAHLQDQSGSLLIQLTAKKASPVLTISNLPTEHLRSNRAQAPHFRAYYSVLKNLPSDQAIPCSLDGAADEGANAFCPPAQTTAS